MIKVMITGANFTNKGAQSMLFITVDEIRKRFPDAHILFQSKEYIDVSEYRFEHVFLDWRIALGGLTGALHYVLRIIVDIVKFIIGKRTGFGGRIKALHQIKDLDLIIDISGYSVGDKWEKEANYEYINKLRYAQKNSIPLYLMPQSIGPFNYENKMSEKEASYIRKQLSIFLQYPIIVFAREREGVKSLKSIGVVDNVVLSPDLVIQNQSINYSNVFKYKPEFNLINVNEKHCVAVVPNYQCARHGSEDDALSLYTDLIFYLEQLGKKVYLIRHSNQDAKICQKLFDRVKERSETVVMIDQELSCFEYDYLIKQFEYVCGSRFHGLVHALRNDVPCIAIGWAIKYKELLESVGLERYVFDISNCFSSDSVIQAIDDMEKNYEENKKSVAERIEKIRKNNCFNFLDEIKT